jgi:uridine kinase
MSGSHVMLRAMLARHVSRSDHAPQVWGICGGSGSGKSTLVALLESALPTQTVSVLHFDAYYRDMAHLPGSERAALNFDHPDSLEADLLARQIDTLLSGLPADAPVYDFATHARLERTERVEPAPLIVIEGILIFAFEQLRERFDHSVFLEVPEPIRLERRIARDMVARGRTEESVRRQFAATVAPMHREFVQPTACYATQLVPYGADFAEVVAGLVERLASHDKGAQATL